MKLIEWHLAYREANHRHDEPREDLLNRFNQRHDTMREGACGELGGLGSVEQCFEGRIR
jgi:hypothetical protein